MKGLRPIDIELMNLSDSFVYREKDKIDILIVSESNKLILAIENKIFTKEHDNQLQRYLDSLRSGYGDNYRFVLIYLTPEGIASSDPDNWIDLSYIFIQNQLELLVKDRNLKEKTKLYIEDYILTIRRHIVEDKEIKEICSKIYFKYKDALDLIYENRPDIRSDISQFLNSFLSEKASELGITFLSDSSTFTTFRFVPNGLLNTKNMGNGWVSDDYLVVFEMYINDSGKTQLSLIIGPAKEDFEHYRQEMMEAVVANKAIFNAKGTKITNKWKTIDTLRISRPSEDDEEDSSAWIERIESELTSYLKNKVPEKIAILAKVFEE